MLRNSLRILSHFTQTIQPHITSLITPQISLPTPYITQRSINATLLWKVRRKCRYCRRIRKNGRIPQTFQQTGLVSMVTQTRGMKVKTSIRKRCDSCYVMKRKGRFYIYCLKKKTHKQRQG
ncbi:Mitochondrial/chloroplast ribosomal protein L36 [Oopsacas minuta]|uniref:Ribosomal protein n=1 Tax=Oopsacas minuta TaxID=111878 RepID=A0AAV7JFR0_9METZ|nr:Mitochondrial/chloroplast ribosomal protein L36 [Oopsacas minuta]